MKLTGWCGLAAVALGAVSCQSGVQDQRVIVSAASTGCTPEQLTMLNLHTDLQGNDVWNVNCRGKTYLCTGVTTKSGGNYSCALVK